MKISHEIFFELAGCDSACRKECIDEINKYHLNHQAKQAQFSQYLADRSVKNEDLQRLDMFLVFLFALQSSLYTHESF